MRLFAFAIPILNNIITNSHNPLHLTGIYVTFDEIDLVTRRSMHLPVLGIWL